MFYYPCKKQCPCKSCSCSTSETTLVEPGHFFPNGTVCSLLQALHCKNMQKARELWDHIMTKGNAKYANMWLEYYNLERSVSYSQQCSSQNRHVVPHLVSCRQ